MPDQCRAVTEGGERCSRPAKENGFCHQHGPENQTVDEADAAETTDADDEREDSNVPEDTDSEEETESADSTESDSDSRNGGGSEAESTAEETDSDSQSDSEESATIVTVRNRVRDEVPQLIGRELDGVTSLMRSDDGWVATVELIERRSVPDTQDILGQYEVSLTDDGVIHEYRRIETYRRAEGSEYEA